MKRVNWKLVILAVVLVIIAAFLIAGIAGYLFKSKLVFGVVSLCACFFGLLMLFLNNIDTNDFTKKIMNKTIQQNVAKYGFTNCSTFTTHNAILKIDAENGRLAYVCNLNPTEFQVISAEKITDIKSDYIKAPLGGTSYVYFQFVCDGIRIRIPTFVGIHCVYSLQSGEVLEGISKADAYAEILHKAKEVAEKNHV